MSDIPTSPSAAAMEGVPAEGNATGGDALQFRLAPAAFLKKRREAQMCYLFDLRSEEDFAEDPFPGSYNLPFVHLEDNLHRLPFQGDLLFYDDGSGLAARAAQMLHENAFTDFCYLSEGLSALREALDADPLEVQYGRLDPEARAQAIEKVLDEKVRSFLAQDGGGLEVVGIEDERIMVSYEGACGGCASATTGTLRFIQSSLTTALNHPLEVVPINV